MGWAIGSSIGAALGYQDGPVVCITGDGAMLMSSHELTTAAAEAKPEEETEVEPQAAPQGLFARVSQRLESKGKDAVVDLNLDNAIESLDKQQREEMIYSLKRQLVLNTRNLNRLSLNAPWN